MNFDMQLARMAVRIFPRTSYNADRVKHLRREWMRSVNELADKWIVAPANRIQRHADKAVSRRIDRRAAGGEHSNHRERALIVQLAFAFGRAFRWREHDAGAGDEFDHRIFTLRSRSRVHSS